MYKENINKWSWKNKKEEKMQRENNKGLNISINKINYENVIENVW